jgi:hypothetical protein
MTETYHLKFGENGHLLFSANGHLVNECAAMVYLGQSSHTDQGWADHNTLAYEFVGDPPVLVPMDPWPYLEWDDLYDDVWSDLADGTDQTIGGTVPDAGFTWMCQQLGNGIDPETEYETTEGVMEAGGTSFAWVTGFLKDKTISNVKLVLTYNVSGATDWTGLTYELRIKDSAFAAGLDTANGQGSQKTTWAEGTDGNNITKEITLAATDLTRDNTTDETHFFVAPVYTKPAFPGPVAPDNEGINLTSGLTILSASLEYEVN